MKPESLGGCPVEPSFCICKRVRLRRREEAVFLTHALCIAHAPRAYFLFVSKESRQRTPPKGKHRFPLGKPLPETTIAYELLLTRAIPHTAPRMLPRC